MMHTVAMKLLARLFSQRLKSISTNAKTGSHAQGAPMKQLAFGQLANVVGGDDLPHTTW